MGAGLPWSQKKTPPDRRGKKEGELKEKKKKRIYLKPLNHGGSLDNLL
ncbi:hypothetical protein UF75_0138 [Desulfosporosinus sp. I2]|nr:hypothetical protein UF75_0138 [Desulfosporosinus sp. I2]